VGERAFTLYVNGTLSMFSIYKKKKKYLNVSGMT